MDDKDALRLRIRKAVFEGHTKSQIFNDIYRQLYRNQQEIPLTLIHQVFGRVWKDAFRKLAPELHPLVNFIKEEYKRYQKIIKEKECLNNCSCRIKFLSRRYALEAYFEWNKFTKFYLYDIIHDQKKELLVENETCSLEEKHQFIGICTIDPEHFLAVFSVKTESILEPITTIQLFKLNASAGTCTVLDTKKLNGGYHNWIAGSPNQFMFSAYNNLHDQEKRFFHRGRVVDSKLQFDKEMLNLEISSEEMERIKNINAFNSCMFEGNKLHHICIKSKLIDYREYVSHKDNHELFYYETKLYPNCLKVENVFEIENKLKENTRKRNMAFGDCFWANNTTFYVPAFSHEGARGVHLFKGNIETREFIKIDWFLAEHYLMSMYYDGGALMLCLKNPNTGHHVWKEVLVNKPDTLCNMAIKFICQKTAFLDKQDYNLFFKQLPLKLRPFGA
ncbi:hypothetical protein M3Y97_01091800 [Aphelenchoides bicaudatus]|nr:hypothetical protein M3Y97_01091800 [Aphelenchoides bicaudatus]